MNSESSDGFFWNEWQDILLAEFEHRLAAIGTKGYRIIPARKTSAPPATAKLSEREIYLAASGFWPDFRSTVEYSARFFLGIFAIAGAQSRSCKSGPRLIAFETASIAFFLQGLAQILGVDLR